MVKKLLVVLRILNIIQKIADMITTDTPKDTLRKAEHRAGNNSLLVGFIGIPSRSTQHLQAAVSTHERVHKDHLQEIARVAHSTQRDLTADYACYVLVPLVLLMLLIVFFRRLLPC